VSVQEAKREDQSVFLKVGWNNKTTLSGDDLWRGGLHLLVVNPWTSQITLSQVFPTGDYGAHRDLSWTLGFVQPGRVVIIASLHDGSQQLGTARQDLQNLGSEWAFHYLYRDSWAWVFFKGGRTLAETISPNLSTPKVHASPLLLTVEIPWPPEGTNLTQQGEAKPENEGVMVNILARNESLGITKETTAKMENQTEGTNEEQILINEAQDIVNTTNIPTAKGLLNDTEDMMIFNITANGVVEDEHVKEDEGGDDGTLDNLEQDLTGLGECRGWGRSEVWRARRVFCDTHDGYGDLCDCDHPFVFPAHRQLTAP
ncbi:O-linked-mannose beta-1-2-N-acetylglucosaminyltransferase 1-like 14, partial [Homarus americanus]